MASLTARRDTLADQILGQLESAAFEHRPLSPTTVQNEVAQANALVIS